MAPDVALQTKEKNYLRKPNTWFGMADVQKKPPCLIINTLNNKVATDDLDDNDDDDDGSTGGDDLSKEITNQA